MVSGIFIYGVTLFVVLSLDITTYVHLTCTLFLSVCSNSLLLISELVNRDMAAVNCFIMLTMVRLGGSGMFSPTSGPDWEALMYSHQPYLHFILK